MLMMGRTANIVGVLSSVALVVLLTLEFWIPFRHLWDVQVAGFLLNSAASLYAARRGNRWWYALAAVNLLAIVGWIVALAG